MTSTQFSLLISIILVHSSLALLTSTFHHDREWYKQRLLITKRTWSPMVASEDRQAIGSADVTSTPVGGSLTEYEDITVIDSKKTRPEKPVLRKCCNFGDELTKKGCVKSESGGPPFLPIVYYNKTYYVDDPLDEIFTLEFGDTCFHGRYRLEPSVEPDDEFYLLDNGSLLQPAISTVFNGAQEFCMEGFFNNGEFYSDEKSVVLPLICFPPPSNEEPDGEPYVEFIWMMYPVGLLISVPFLLIVLIAHILIPKLNCTVNGKCLIGHISFLIVGYVGLASIQLSRSLLPDDLCKAIAFVVQFSFIACFSWLFAMCFRIWIVISNVSTSLFTTPNMHKSFRSKAFLKYFFFALTIPVLIVLVSLVMDLTPSIPSSLLKPQFGVGSCWFLTDAAALRYFYGPISILIMGNVVLFILTARTIIQKSKMETILTRPMERNRTQIIKYENRALKVCFTLFILMGVNWVMEIISWATGNGGGMALKSVWYITDMFNALRGLFIFIIFLFDSEFRSLVKEKLYCWGYCKSCSEDVDEKDCNKQNQHLTFTALLQPQHPTG